MKKAFLAMLVIVSFLIVGNLIYAQNSPEPLLSTTPSSVEVPDNLEVATFAGGCFWCTEAAFQELEGVSEVISGYAGGEQIDPTYEDVYTQNTDHREAVQIIYDPEVITYGQLLDTLWPTIDPTDDGGQFVDRGFSYTTAIFYHDDSQMLAAQSSKQTLAQSERFGEQELVTPILPYTTFYEAEEYHQDFYLNSKERYKGYSDNSGRDEYKAVIWNIIQSEDTAR